MSKLSAALSLAERGFRVFPLVPNSKLPAIKNFSEQATSDAAQIRKWFEGKDYNIGISTDDLIAVDVDVKGSRDGFKTIERLNHEGNYFPPTTTQTTPTGGAHLLYKTDVPRKNSVSKLGPGLDIRARGGFVVGAGSCIDSKPYTVNDAPAVPAPDWLQESLAVATDDKPRAREIAAQVDPDKAWDRGARHLASIPPTTTGERNRAGFLAACQLKDIGVQKSDAVALMLEFWKCEPMLEIEELKLLVRSAYTNGQNPQGSASPEALFTGPAEPAPGPSASVNPVEALNATYAFLQMKGKYVIIEETTDADGKFTTNFLEEQTFHKKLCHLVIQEEGGGVKQISQLWIRSPKRRNYDGPVFKPERKVDPRFYNLWRGFGVTPLAEGEVPTEAMVRYWNSFTHHIFNNAASGNEEHYQWIMTWLAHMVQKPWEKPKTALVLRGAKGVGKNEIFESIRPLFPENYLVSGDARYLTSNFNSHLERLILFVADEAFWSGDKAAEGVLKSLITDDRVNIERKGKDPISMDSCHRIAILGNDKWVAPASPDERRFAIFKMGEGNKQDRVFFKQFKRDRENGGSRYLFTRLRDWDGAGVDIGQIPDTPELLAQKERTLTVERQWWLENLISGVTHGISSGFADNVWARECTVEDFKTAYQAFARSIGKGGYLLDNSALRSAWQDMCPSTKFTGARVAFPSLEVARQEWNEFMGSERKWD